MTLLIAVQQEGANHDHSQARQIEKKNVPVTRVAVSVQPVAAQGVQPQVGGIAHGGGDAHGGACDLHGDLGFGNGGIHAGAGDNGNAD